jgi:capsular exopolysaccharide synthesis family protein
MADDTPAQQPQTRSKLPIGPAADSPPLTIWYALRIARKHLALFLAISTATTALAIFASLAATRVYRAEALLRLDPEPPRPLGSKVDLVSSQQGSYWNRREFYETEFRVMKSRRVATAVVRSLGLNADPDFLGINKRNHATFQPVDINAAADALIGRISLEPVKDSSLVSLRYEDTDPKRCERVLNALVRVYLAQNLDATTSMSTNAVEWLNSQLETLRGGLEKSEVALNDYRQKNNVLSISLEDRHNLIASELEFVAKEITTLEIKRIEIGARNIELRAVKVDDPMVVGASELLQGPVLSALRTSYAEERRAVDELVPMYDVGHPKLASAQAKLDSTKKLIATEVNNIQTASDRDLRAVSRQIADLKVKDADIQKQAHELQSFEIRYNQLQRDKQNNEKIYGIVLERTRETELTRMMNFNNIQVVDEAIQPKVPIRPNVPASVAFGAVVGILLGMAAGAARELADSSLKTPADVENILGLPCLGLLPEMAASKGRSRSRRAGKGQPYSPDRDLLVAAHPDGGVAEATRAVRTNLMFISPDRPYRNVLVTSAVPEEGKTTVACSLAIVLAQGGHRVLLVDTDLRRPRLHRTFRVANDVGVTLAIAGQLPLDDCIRATEIPNLFVLTSGPIPPNPAELLQSERFAALTRTLADKFDRVVYDSPPILPVTDAAIISRLVDGVVAVVRGFKTQKSAARQAMRQILDVNGHIAGVVLNAIDLTRHDYREYHYYYRRDGYYTRHDDDVDGAPPPAAPASPRGAAPGQAAEA